MKTKITAFALALTLFLPNIADAKPSAAARSNGFSVSSSRSSSSPMQASTASKAVSPAASPFERNAMRRAGASSVNTLVNSRPSPSAVPPGPSPTPSYPRTASSAPQSSYQPPASIPSQPYYNRPQVVVHDHYHHDDGGSGLLTGMVTGMALGAMASHHDEAHAAPAPSYNPSYDYSNYPDVAPVQHSSGSHAFVTFLLLFFLFVLIASGVAYFWFKRSSKDYSGSEEVMDNATAQVKKPIVPGFPTLMPGAIMNVDNSYFANDPNSPNPQLQAELDKTGTVTVAGVSMIGDDTVNVYADRKQDEFARLAIDGNEIEAARYYAYTAEYPILGQTDWLAWVGEDGMIGNQWFQTGDVNPIRWKRTIFSDTEDRIAPDTVTETIKMVDKELVRSVTEMTYFRNTGFSDPFAKREYLIIQAIRTVDSAGCAVCYVRVYCGVEMSPYSLQLS